MTSPVLAYNVPRKGRHYAHPVTGVEVPSITNCIGVLDKPALPRWSAKMVAENAWKMRHSLDAMGEDECVDVLKGSPWRKSTRAADRGTSVHDYLEAQATGRDVVLEGEALTYKVGADDFLERFQPVFVRTEFTVFGDGYAGTADFMAIIDGRLVVGDYKTGKGLYPEVALQLAAIRYATEIVDEDGSVSPMQNVEGAVAVLITPEKAKVCEVDAGPSAHHAFLACVQAWEWQKSGNPIGVELGGCV